jgi:cell surface protein SprA
MSRVLLPFSLFFGILSFALNTASGSGFKLEDPYVLDTIPPITDRFGDFITDPNKNPFDLKDPNSIEQNVEYDPQTGRYIITETIGGFDFRPPTYLTFEEYMEWRRKKEENDYFKQLSGVNTGGNLSAVDPIAKFDVESSVIDRLFGGTTVDIRPQGSIDLTFGVDFQRLDNPILTERQRRQGGFDFDMAIQMNVTGKIGEKLTLSTNYNTNATFDFDNRIKLDYNSDLFSEDDIIKKIEAGNVSLPLRGTLIQGAQSLFGLKTELQFGHLRLTAIASQQNSQRENIQVQGGSQLQEFEVRADEYDENRHFFLTHYNRDAFEQSLRNLPQINTLFRLEKLEVWITNDRNEVENVRDIVAFADLGEPTRLVNPQAVPPFPTPRFREVYDGRALPDNDANDLFKRLLENPQVREIDQAVAILQTQFGLEQARDFEKVSARKLRESEYTFHPELGMVSVNINVRPDQVLAVGFRYTYNGKPHRVGEISNYSETVGTDTSNLTPKVLFVKMLKSTTQRTDVPTWDLMMKNVYSIGAFQVNQEDFRLDIFYDDPGKGVKRFLPETNLEGRPLLRVFNLDNLNTQGDPTPDGIFDFVPGVTINPRNGRVMFPVLEPFGSDLGRQIDDPALRKKYVYDSLYTTTVFLARESAEQNRFIIKGSYKSSVSSEISLGAFNIPPNSVRVSAGGQLLREGQDYEVDYSTGRVRILNDAILSSGVPINVSFEDNTLFGFQSKTMLGLRADYQLNKDFGIGATFLQLFERPFTQKVNIGDDPINNKIFGLDMNFSREAPWLTKAVDAIPLLSTNQPSSINFMAEAAYIKPGHARAINENRRDKGGVVYIDDFEGSASSFDLRQPVNQWFLASVPQNDAQNNNPLFPESQLNGLVTGVNRARLNWYRIDPSARGPGDDQNPYTSQVPQEEVFPNVQLQPDQLPNVQTLDLTYYPSERGPYNFDLPNGYPGYSRGLELTADTLLLVDPATRWGGIMRALNTNDFQSANIEFMEFWMLSPFLDPEDPMSPSPDYQRKEGTIYINLGNVSEDILKDSRMFFENGLPGPTNPDRRTDDTEWGIVPVSQQITRAFDIDAETRERQDVGLDGLNNDEERSKFRNYIEAIRAVNPNIAAKVELDPSNDDFRYYRDPSFSSEDGILQRYRDFNNPQGNSRSNLGSDIRQSGTNIPDSEDINRDNTLNETESYFQYAIKLFADPINPREVDMQRTPYITDRQESATGERVWYRFRVPLNGPGKVSVGGIRDFRSIRFLRMYLHDFESPVVLRFARLELVRNQWRRYTRDLTEPGDISGTPDNCGLETNFDVDAVNIEENSSREPFNYVLPEGIQREQSLGVFNALQNEQALTMKIEDLCDGDSRAIFKIVDTDMRVYEKLKMFVHAEAKNNMNVPDGALRIFLRLGSDFQNNYYEYEIPLVMSVPDNLPANRNDVQYKREVWRQENEFNFDLKMLRELKELRNEQGIALNVAFERILDPGNTTGSHVIRVRGNPNLGMVKVAMVGVRNPYDGDGAAYSTEVWANELRLTGLDERGAVAAIARMDMQLADLGNLTLAGNVSSVGFGALDHSVHQRSREQIAGYDVATSLELGKFFPEDWGIRLPFYGQLSNTTRTPEFDPYDLDIILKDKLRDTDEKQVRDSLRKQSQDVTSIKSYNFTNVRKERTNQEAKPKPWDIENFSASYSYTQTDRSDPIIEADRTKRYSGGFDYRFSRRVKYLEPFKGIKSKYLQLIKEINLNPLPNSFSFSTILDRTFQTTSYRFAGVDPRFNTFFNKRYSWGRDYDLQWDLTKALKLNFNAVNFAVIDEPDEIALLEDPTITNPAKVRRDSIWKNIQKLGRTKNYQHNLTVSYTLPLRYLPFMDWVQVRANYQGSYSWAAAALNVDSLGNVIQNSQNRGVNADLNFERLYDKWSYLRDISRGSAPLPRGGQQQPRTRTPDKPDDAADDKKKGSGQPGIVEKVLIRPLLSLRRARFNYTERFQTVVPGFMPQSKLLGMESGFGAPGWGFVAGLQPRIRDLNESEWYTEQDWLFQNRQYISRSIFFNQEVIQDFTQNYDVQVNLEPIKDFRVDLELNRSFTENHTQLFKDTVPDAFIDYVHATPLYAGSLTTSFSALSTLFQDSRQEIVQLFKEFEQNRIVISRRLGIDPHQDPNLAEQGYTYGYGKDQQDVLIPAFLAAYTGQDPNRVSMNIFSTKPRVNWRLSYNGLSRVPLFSKVFTNFNVSHGYRSSLSVNNFETSIDFLSTREDFNGIDTLSGNFFPRLEIPQVVIEESFSPLIGVDATLQNGMSFNFNFKKARSLAWSFTNKQLNETQTKEFVIGFGYLLRNVDIPLLTGSKKKRRPAPKPETTQPQTTPNQRGGRGAQLQGRDLDINFDFSVRDDVTFAHRLDEGIFEPTRGSYSLSLSPSAEYKLNRRLSLRLFFDYRRNVPKTSAGFPRTDTAGGVVVRFTLD